MMVMLERLLSNVAYSLTGGLRIAPPPPAALGEWIASAMRGMCTTVLRAAPSDNPTAVAIRWRFSPLVACSPRWGASVGVMVKTK